MKGNYCWSELQQAVLWMLIIPSLCLDTNVLHICQIDGDAAEAGSDGSIINPIIAREGRLDCTLRLTGVPKISWFGLYVETLALPCASQYCSNTGWGIKCTTDESYIKIADLNEKICQPTATGNLYHYKDDVDPVSVRLYSDYFTSDHSFNLTYRVASVIDTGEGRTNREVDTDGQQFGYIVSHSTYGNENYRENINSNLTLTSLPSNSIEIRFFHLDLRPNNCTDKLIIYGLNTTTIICADDIFEYVEKWKNFEPINNTVTFQFVSDSNSTATESGFMFKYEVLTSTTTLGTHGISITNEPTIGTPLLTQSEQTSDERLVNSTDTVGTTPGNNLLNLFDTVVLHICQTDGDTAEAGSEGSIINPIIAREGPLECTLRLTGVPEISWFGLYGETLALPCASEYCFNTGWGSKCTTDEAYIKIDNLNKNICQPTATGNLYYYKNSVDPVTVMLYSDYFTSEHNFNLTYRVASVIDTGAEGTHREVNTTGQQSGYVVSHSTYGNENYIGNINSNLTLTSLRSNSVEIHLYDLDLRPNNCTDKFIIYGLYTTTICANDSSEYVAKWKYFETINNQVTFQFVSDSHSTATESGFMFKYEVLETQPSPTPLVPTTTHKTTHVTPMSTPSNTYRSTIGAPGSTQSKLITNETLPQTTGTGSTTIGNYHSNISDTVLNSSTTQISLASSKAQNSTIETSWSTGSKQITSETLPQTTAAGSTKAGNYFSVFSDTGVTTPSSDGGAWYMAIGVGVGSGLLLAIGVAIAAAIGIKTRRNRRINARRRNEKEERRYRKYGSRLTDMEVAMYY